MFRHNRAKFLVLFALIAFVSAPAYAQDYPSRPLIIVVPFGVGSGADIGARQAAEKMRPSFKQLIVVMNRSGANGMNAASYVAKSTPDGYTIFYGSNSTMAAAPAFFKFVPYDPIKDFASVAIVNETAFLLLGQPGHTGTSVSAHMEKMRADPNFSIGGLSTLYEMLDKMIRNATGAKHVYVPYNDQGKAFTDLIGKRITGVYASVSSAIPLIRSGQAHPIAVASTERLKSLPSVPTLMETYPDLALGVWNGFFAPAKTPQRVLESLSPHIFTAYRDPDVVKRVEEGGRSLHMGPDEADKFLRSEFVRWSELVRSLGIEPQ